MTTAVITQSNYLPWRGYFDLFRQADVVVLMDSVQYTRRDWRNRNVIKATTGPVWLTVPVEVKGRYYQAVDETRVADPGWAAVHRRAIYNAYRKAAAFDSEAPWLFELLEGAAAEPLLSRINETTLRALCARLGIATPVRRCVDLMDRAEMAAMSSTERLVGLAQAVGADTYLSAPAAKAYLDESAFRAVGIEVAWMSYDGYAEYPQVGEPFNPQVSVIDLLLNCGSEARSFIGPTGSADEPGTGRQVR